MFYIFTQTVFGEEECFYEAFSIYVLYELFYKNFSPVFGQICWQKPSKSKNRETIDRN